MEEFLEKLESIRNSYVVIQGQYVVSIYQLDELIQETKDKISNQVDKPVGVPKPKLSCESCGNWNAKNLECKKDIIWLNRDKNIFMNISGLKTGINFYCSNHTQLEQL